jgi:hypothetical protein
MFSVLHTISHVCYRLFRYLPRVSGSIPSKESGSPLFTNDPAFFHKREIPRHPGNGR